MTIGRVQPRSMSRWREMSRRNAGIVIANGLLRSDASNEIRAYRERAVTSSARFFPMQGLDFAEVGGTICASLIMPIRARPVPVMREVRAGASVAAQPNACPRLHRRELARSRLFVILGDPRGFWSQA